MSTELTWVLMVVWFVVTTSAIGELSYAWIVSRVPKKALRASPLKRWRQYLSAEKAHSATINWSGTDKVVMRITHGKLGVLAAQMPRQVRRDPRSEPGGNLTDPY